MCLFFNFPEVTKTHARNWQSAALCQTQGSALFHKPFGIHYGTDIMSQCTHREQLFPLCE